MFKPMLAGKAEPEKLRFPVMVSPKLDGIRAIVLHGQLVSRTLKPIPNNFIRNLLSKGDFNGLDGELIVGEPTAKDCFNQSTSAVMRSTGEPNFKFHVFDDHTEPEKYFHDRRSTILNTTWPDFIEMVPHHWALDLKELMDAEKTFVEAGYEGLMIRDPYGVYKFGRSTTNEGLLLKLKRFCDSEAEIIGWEELMHNANEAQKDNFGRTKRSSHQENLVPTGTLGAFIVRDLQTGIEFKIGTGFNQTQRESFWKMEYDFWKGQIVKYKYFDVGVKIAPRHPVFLGFRNLIDL